MPSTQARATYVPHAKVLGGQPGLRTSRTNAPKAMTLRSWDG